MTDIMIKFKVRRGKTKVKKTVIKARTKLTLAEFESPRVAMQNELISKNTAVILKPRRKTRNETGHIKMTNALVPLLKRESATELSNNRSVTVL